MKIPNVYYGVDFSGAARAGKKIWITEANPDETGIVIRRCFQAENLPGASAQRDRCLPALLSYIAEKSNGVFGLDFPFSLPVSMLGEADWESFVLSFADRFPDPDIFRDYCRNISGRPELKRLSDIESKAPFAPYNLWIYRQTYYGIREILAPLIRAGTGCIIPLQQHHARLPWILETCPASILKKFNLYFPYKGASKRASVNRGKILNYLTEECRLLFDNKEITALVLNDRQGDGLDSILTVAIIAHLMKHPRNLLKKVASPYFLEGIVYY